MVFLSTQYYIIYNIIIIIYIFSDLNCGNGILEDYSHHDSCVESYCCYSVSEGGRRNGR